MSNSKFINYMPYPNCGHHLNPKPHPDKPDVFLAYCPLCDDGWELPLHDREVLAELLKYDVCNCSNKDCNLCDLGRDEDACYEYLILKTAEYLIANGVGIQKNGEWRPESNGYICSACNNWSCCNAPYCPECGAKMANS